MGPRIRLTLADKRKMHDLVVNQQLEIAAVARRFGVGHKTAWNAVRDVKRKLQKTGTKDEG